MSVKGSGTTSVADIAKSLTLPYDPAAVDEATMDRIAATPVPDEAEGFQLKVGKMIDRDGSPIDPQKWEIDFGTVRAPDEGICTGYAPHPETGNPAFLVGPYADWPRLPVSDPAAEPVAEVMVPAIPLEPAEPSPLRERVWNFIMRHAPW